MPTGQREGWVVPIFSFRKLNCLFWHPGLKPNCDAQLAGPPWPAAGTLPAVSPGRVPARAQVRLGELRQMGVVPANAAR